MSSSAVTVLLVDTLEKVQECVEFLHANSSEPIAVDAEGVDLAREGKLCILQIQCQSRCFLVDVSALGAQAAFGTTFNMSGSIGGSSGSHGTVMSLKALLENPRPLKIMFDCRTDCDALLHQCGVRINGVFDCQLADVLIRRQSNDSARFVSGLGKCIDNYLSMTSHSRGFASRKLATQQLFSPEYGGNPLLWDTRPMSEQLLSYAAEDVQVLFPLYNSMIKRFKFNNNHERIMTYTAKYYLSIRDLPIESPQGKERAVAPKW